jgi:sugar-specific transcriptional regulator TrmB
MSVSSRKALHEIGSRAQTTLRELGFGAHESEVILALNEMSSGSVSELAAKTGIHHANLYAVLDSLASRGLVVSHEGRPRIYEFAPIVHLEEMLTAKVSQLLGDLEALQDARESKTEIPALIYTIKGSSDVQAKIYSMIERARDSILIVAPTIESMGLGVRKALNAASNRGVRIQAILGVAVDPAEVKLEQRVKVDTTAIDLVVDSAEALISMPDLSVCGWADNPLISMQLEEFLQQTWHTSKKV